MSNKLVVPSLGKKDGNRKRQYKEKSRKLIKDEKDKLKIKDERLQEKKCNREEDGGIMKKGKTDKLKVRTRPRFYIHKVKRKRIFSLQHKIVCLLKLFCFYS